MNCPCCARAAFGPAVMGGAANAAAFQQLLTSQTPAAEPTWVECSKRLDTQGYLSFSLKWEADPVKFIDVVEAAVALGVAKAKQLPHGGVCMSEEEWKARTEAEDAVAFGTHAPGSDAAAAASQTPAVASVLQRASASQSEPTVSPASPIPKHTSTCVATQAAAVPPSLNAQLASASHAAPAG